MSESQSTTMQSYNVEKQRKGKGRGVFLMLWLDIEEFVMVLEL